MWQLLLPLVPLSGALAELQSMEPQIPLILLLFLLQESKGEKNNWSLA